MCPLMCIEKKMNKNRSGVATSQESDWAGRLKLLEVFISNEVAASSSDCASDVPRAPFSHFHFHNHTVRPLDPSSPWRGRQ